jgi:hypothetical protein
MKKLHIALISVAAIILVLSVLWFTPNFRQTITSFNNGGGIFYEFGDVMPVYNLSMGETSIGLPIVTIFYPGVGWDEICYGGFTRVYLLDSDDNVLQAQKIMFTNNHHDAGKRNIPGGYAGMTNFDLSGLSPGRYRLEANTIISTIDDVPDTGLCGAITDFQVKITEADTFHDFTIDPESWVGLFEANNYYRQGKFESRRFIVTEKGDEIPDKPDFDWVLASLIASGMVTLGLGSVYVPKFIKKVGR